MIDWSQCPDVERSADTLSGAWRIKGHRIPVQAILDNAEDCSAEEIATEIFPSVSLDVVKRILAFAGVKALDYSDIPPLGDEFFARATHPPAPRKALPFEPLVPNKQTIEAMKAAERGEVTTVGHPRNLLKSL